MTARTRLLAFAPLVVLTLLTGAAAVGSLVLADDPPVTSGRPTASPSATPSRSPSPTPYVAPPSAEPTWKARTLRQARKQWDGALTATAKDLSGKYSWSAWVRGEKEPIAHEEGVFGLDPIRTSFERELRDPDSETSTTYTMRMRRQGDKTYMQMADWGPWDGCWLAITPGLVKRSTGIDPTEALSLALPVPVVVALDSTVTNLHPATWFGDPYVEYLAEVTAVEALQFLGINGTKLVQFREQLTRVKVPIVVAVGVDEKAKGAAARGPDVASALRRAQVRLPSSVTRYLAVVNAAVVFWGLGDPAYVTLPGPRSVLPADATRKDTCSKAAPPV